MARNTKRSNVILLSDRRKRDDKCESRQHRLHRTRVERQTYHRSTSGSRNSPRSIMETSSSTDASALAMVRLFSSQNLVFQGLTNLPA
jgi:hypothetical protein